MRKIILSMQMTIDGYSTGPNDEMDYLPPFNNEELWKDLHQEMWKNLESADTFILGRRTYQIWQQYWPSVANNPQSTESDKRFSRFAAEAKKIVISSTLDRAEWKNTMLIKDNIAEEIQKLKEQSRKEPNCRWRRNRSPDFCEAGADRRVPDCCSPSDFR